MSKRSLTHYSLLITHYSYIEPGRDHDVLDSKQLSRKQLRRKRPEDRYRKELKDKVLQKRRALKNLLLELIPGDQLVGDPPKDEEENPYDKRAEKSLQGLAREADEVGQVAVDLIDYRVVIPGLARPEPYPPRPAHEGADDNQ